MKMSLASWETGGAKNLKVQQPAQNAKYCRERADAWVGLDLKRSRLGTPLLDAGQRKDVKVEAPPHPAQNRLLPDRNLDLGSRKEREKRLA